ncbi:hypothetical protein PBRA_000492, partial [Plasmodiophora brassicae]
LDRRPDRRVQQHVIEQDEQLAVLQHQSRGADEVHSTAEHFLLEPDNQLPLGVVLKVRRDVVGDLLDGEDRVLHFATRVFVRIEFLVQGSEEHEVLR